MYIYILIKGMSQKKMQTIEITYVFHMCNNDECKTCIIILKWNKAMGQW